jgi:PAS domain S-box-containing protein
MATAQPPRKRLLDDAQEEHRLLMACLTDYAIFMLDLEGRVAEWNAGAERIFGFAEHEILGRPGSLVFTPEDAGRGVPQQELLTAEHEGRADDERWHARKDGSRFWASGVMTALRDEAGVLRGFAKVCRDLTERRRLEEALAEADRRKDEFLAVLGHELRHPLTPARHAVDVLNLLEPVDPKVAWARGILDRQVRQMARLVDDLSDMALIRRGTIRILKEPVELAAVVAQAVEMSRPLTDGREQGLTVSVPAEPAWLDADPARLAQVLVNLLHNASKYTDRGGRIGLTARREGGEVVLRVEDDGSGIPAETLPRVFDPFTQGGRRRAGWGWGWRWHGGWSRCTAGTCRPTAAGRAGGASSSSACRPCPSRRTGAALAACSSWTTGRT